MAAPRAETPRGPEEKPSRESQAEPAAEAAKEAKGGGWKAWLPLGVALVVMPLAAFAVTKFVLVPQMRKGLVAKGALPVAAAEKPHDAGASHKEGASEANGARQSVLLNKLLVNVAGTMGSRYLLTSLTLVGTAPNFSDRVKENNAQLVDMACGLLSTKTIADLEKPGARNVIRGELLAGFNSILGNSAVQEIYFTEFAIQ